MSPGILYIIGSPIGNMEDITLRAVRILKEEVRLVICEDTRQTRKLLDRYGIDLPLTSLHSHTPQAKIDHLLDQIADGITAAYLTDSGTPSISDPGSRIVSEARNRGVPVIPLPGPTALATLLSVSGFPGSTVIFTGFLSKKEGRRVKELEQLKAIPAILVIYESPYRIKKTLSDLRSIYPGARIVIGREMTKHFEEYLSGTIEEIIDTIDNLKEKGEFTIALLNE